MKEKLIDLGKRMSNVGTILALVSAVVFILMQFGITVDSEKVNNVVEAVCSILVLLGILNNPKSSGIYLPFVNGIDKEE